MHGRFGMPNDILKLNGGITSINEKKQRTGPSLPHKEYLCSYSSYNKNIPFLFIYSSDRSATNRRVTVQAES